MVSRAARSWSASRSSSFNLRAKELSNTRSSGPVPQRAYRRFQSSIEFPQEHQNSGVCDATSNQWWQTRRKLYEPFTSLPKSPSGVTFHPKMLPSISGGRRVDTFNSEFRVRFSWIMAFLCSSICFSSARMESRLISRSIAVGGSTSGIMKCHDVPSTHIDGEARSRFVEGENSTLVLKTRSPRADHCCCHRIPSFRPRPPTPNPKAPPLKFLLKRFVA